MSQPRNDLARLASYVISARIEAGYGTRKDFADAIGVTARTLGKLETAAERVSADTLARVAKGLGWTPDSPGRVLAGLEPLSAAPPRLSVVPGRPTIEELLAELPAEPTDEEFAAWIARFPDGDRIDVLAADAARKIWALDYLPAGDRSRLIKGALTNPGKPGEARRSGAG